MPAQSEDTVEHFMHRDLEVVAQDDPVVAAAARMSARRIGSVLVESVEAGGGNRKITGIVTEADLVRKVIAQSLIASQTRVARVMASPLLTIAPDRPMLDASHFMERNQIRHLCVSDGGTVVGLISVRDLARHFVNADGGPVRALEDVYRPLGVLMRTTLETIDREATLLVAAQRMASRRIGSLLVAQRGETVGIVTESDLVRKALARDLDPGLTNVGSVMTHPVIAIDINRTVHDASELMAEKGVRHLTVTENRKIVGIVSVRDLIRMVSVRDQPRFLREQ